MMRYLWKLLPAFVVTATMASCGGKDNPDPVPTPEAPTAVTLSSSSAHVAQPGEEITLDITSPSRPAVSGETDWATAKLGIFNAQTFKMTGVKITVSANPTYETRTATLTFKAGSASATFAITQAGKEVIPDPVLPDNDAVARARELGLGWNMGNQLDAINNGVSNETCWGNPEATQATFDGVKAAGFTSVRIPVTWEGHIGAAPDYQIDDAWMNRVYEVVGYARNAGLNVILNTHHDEDHGEGYWQNLKGAVDNAATNKQVKEEIAAVWSQIAEKFKEEGDYLMLESFNELIYGKDAWDIGSNAQKKADVINEWNQVFVDAVRATGGNNATRWLGVPGYAANPRYLQYFKLPDDSARKTMVDYHCYDPYDYTIGDKQLPNWGHTSTSYPKGEEEIKELFNSLYTKYIANNIPIYMGEFGCSFRSQSDAKAWAYFNYYLEYVVKAAKTFGIPAFLWDNGGSDGAGKEKHHYINHGTGQYYSTSKEPVQTMVKAWTSTDPTYTLQAVYDSAPEF